MLTSRIAPEFLLFSTQVLHSLQALPPPERQVSLLLHVIEPRAARVNAIGTATAAIQLCTNAVECVPPSLPAGTRVGCIPRPACFLTPPPDAKTTKQLFLRNLGYEPPYPRLCWPPQNDARAPIPVAIQCKIPLLSRLRYAQHALLCSALARPERFPRRC